MDELGVIGQVSVTSPGATVSTRNPSRFVYSAAKLVERRLQVGCIHVAFSLARF